MSCESCPRCGRRNGASGGGSDYVYEMYLGAWFRWCPKCWVIHRQGLIHMKAMRRYRFWRRLARIIRWIERL